MFDIAFSEIVIIAVVALIVIGPEKLPKTARTLGHLFGRLQRYVSDVKADINREIELDELRKLQQEVQTAAKGIETSISSAVRDVETGARAVESDLNTAALPVAPPAPVADMLPLSTPPPDVASAAPAPTVPPAAPAPASAIAPPATAAPAEPARQAALPGFERG